MLHYAKHEGETKWAGHAAGADFRVRVCEPVKKSGIVKKSAE